ncbi:MAG: ATP-dependent DNA helicase RecG [PVC group bacterium]|nr:ATP-dependent DNA helicase RecG [PVC group bacterium]
MRNSYDNLNQSAQYLKGVGPKKIQLLNKLNISTVKGLLYYFPRRYEDRSKFIPINRVRIGNTETIKGKVVTSGLRRTRGKMKIFQVAVADTSGVIYGTWFNQPYLKNYFKIDDEVILHGRVERYGNLQINAPEYEILKPDEEDNTIHTGRVVPIYALTQYVSQRYLRMISKRCVDEYSVYLKEYFPDKIVRQHDLLPLKDAVVNIHFPEQVDMIKAARKRLVFDEFFFFELALALKRRDIKEEKKGIQYNLKGDLIDKFKKSLPFELTSAQKKVVQEIETDMNSQKPMNRLLQGDVGSGKTIVSIWALVLCVQNGYQAALMAPTEILAQQHYQTINEYLMPLGLNAVVLSGGLKKKEKENVLGQINDGKINIIIGTHALIQDEVVFKKLGLVVVDEQHKFGVVQRVKLQKKGRMPDVLVMSATPIPRTLAITLYGDLDVSTIRELPPGRTPVDTFWINERKRADLYEFLRKKIKETNQVYVVYPVVEQSKIKDLKAATKMYEHFKDDIFTDCRVGLVHGRMKDVEKKEVMNLFKKGEIDILVATTVIEVGIDVSNASIMLIEHAERFGLSQLHQLRGRVGRGQKKSYCILLSEGKTEEAQKRLSAMTQTSDGFKIAEYDLLIRGPGEFFGTRQHGLPELRIGNIITDIDVLTQARKEAFDYLEGNPSFSGVEGEVLKEELLDRFPHNKDLILAR